MANLEKEELERLGIYEIESGEETVEDVLEQSREARRMLREGRRMLYEPEYPN